MCDIGVQQFETCQNVTFTETSFNTSFTNEFSLEAGNACVHQINRTKLGSYGTVTFSYDNPNLVIFDQYLGNVESGTELGLPLSNVGWDPRTVLIVNAGTDQVQFQA